MNILPTGKTALIDMHNDTAFAAQSIKACVAQGIAMAIVQSSLDTFLERATDEEKQVYLRYQNQIQVLPDLIRK